MNTSFISPTGYLCLNLGGGCYLDVAFISIPAGATYAECVSYAKEKNCEIMKGSDRALKVLNLLGDHPPKTGRVIILAVAGGLVVCGNHIETLRCEEVFAEGDLLLCCRDSVFGMSDMFPKDPFTGKCKMIEAQEEDY